VTAKVDLGQHRAWAPLLYHLGLPREGARREDPSRVARLAAREGRRPWRAGCEHTLEVPAPEVTERPRGGRQDLAR